MVNQVLTNIQPLRLHLDSDDSVWYSAAEEPPQWSGLPIHEFIQHQAFLSADTVQVLGFPQNASLIRYIHVLRTEGHGPRRVQVGTPAICPSATERSRPDVVLTRMRTLNRHSSVGGWHDMREEEYGAYALAAAWLEGAPREMLQQALVMHPAYPALAFLGEPEPSTAAALLSTIMDPRWYLDPSDPRRSHVFSFLGCWPRFFDAMVQGEAPNDPRFHRVTLAVLNWAGRMPPRAKPYSQYAYNFLWRAFNTRLVRGNAESIALLRTTRLFLRFLCEVWTDNVVTRELFVPEYFFAHESDAIAYKQFVLTRRVEPFDNCHPGQ